MMAEQRLFDSDHHGDVSDSRNIAEFKESKTDLKGALLNAVYKFTDSMVFVGETVSTISTLLGKKLLSETVKAFSRLRVRTVPHAQSLLLILQLSLVRLCEPALKLIRSVGVIRQRAQLAGETAAREMEAECSPSHIRKAAALEAFRTTRELIWESRKLALRSFSYAAPIFSIMFFAGIVRYASNLEYAVNIMYNGQDLGYIAAESDYDIAEQAVQQKISYVAGNETVTFTPRLSLKIIQDSADYINPSELADKLITNSESALVQAYGFYIGGEFCAAVTDKAEIEKALDAIIQKYQGIEGAENIAFIKQPSFEESIFLADTIVEAEKVAELLNSVVTPALKYTLTEQDTLESVIDRFNVSQEKIEFLNPDIAEKWAAGVEIILSVPESFMPVSYTVNTEFITPIAYNTITIDDASRYEGYKEITIKGQNGELTNTKQNLYVDGYLTSSEIISSVTTKEAVTENVVIGTRKNSSYSENIPVYTGPIDLDGTTDFIWPCNGGKRSSGFGYRWGSLHGAVDISAPVGTDIYAAQDGVVVLAGRHYSYGNYVVIDHGNNIVTLYAHASALVAQTGDYVKTGDVIAKVGNTGTSYGNHLHFEIRINGVRVDPELYIKKP